MDESLVLIQMKAAELLVAGVLRSMDETLSRTRTVVQMITIGQLVYVMLNVVHFFARKNLFRLVWTPESNYEDQN